jgi:chorismate lyase
LKPISPATILHPTLRWRPLERGHYPPEIADWLADSGSLTQRLQRLGRFHVIPQQQSITLPRAEEARLLGLAPRRAALIREVLLYLGDTPVVFARSVLPLASLHGRNRILGHMARRSLGAELFKTPRAQREQVWTAQADITTAAAVGPIKCFGRQSLFRKRGQPLLVAEFFLPTLFDLGRL